MEQNEIQVHKPATIKVSVVDFHESDTQSAELCVLADKLNVDIISIAEERNELGIYTIGTSTVTLIGGGPLAYVISIKE